MQGNANDVHEDHPEARVGWAMQTWTTVRAHAPELSNVYEAARDLLFGVILGAVTAVLIGISVHRDIPWLRHELARFLPGKIFERPDFFDLAYRVGSIAFSVLGVVLVGWVLVRFIVSWWHGKFRGILLMWWITTTAWLYLSRGVFGLQLLW